MKTTPCSYCHQPTNHVYNDERCKGTNNRLLVSACPECASEIPYLGICMIFKEPTYKPLEFTEETTHQQIREDLDQIRGIE